jgi:drug/metabolite transporter (DMT)-like permease
MSSLLLSILFSVLLLVNFRFFPKYGISTFQAIAFNYVVCFLTGLVLMQKTQKFNLDFSQNWTWYFLGLGLGFILTFILSGAATQKIGMTLTSLANNISLVIPVLFSLLVFGSTTKTFDGYNYAGLLIAVLAIGIATFKNDSDTKGSFFTKGGLALAVFFMYGITNTALNYLNINFIPEPDLVIPNTLIMVFGAAVSGLLLLVYRLIRGQDKIEIKNIMAAVTLGVPNFLSFYFLIKALSFFGNSGAFVYPIYNIGVILVSAVVSILLFKEKLSKLNIIGLVLAVFSIFLISWQEIFI